MKMNENNVGAQSPKISGAQIVRRADGTPRFDDIHNIPAELFRAVDNDGNKLLNQTDLQYIEHMRNQ